jgi:hypothetical protein
MKLTKISNDNIDKTIQIIQKYPVLNQKYKKNHFMKIIFDLLKKATKANIETIIHPINTKENIPLDLSSFIPNHIKEYILTHSQTYHKINITIGNNHFTIYVFSYHKINIQKLTYYLKMILYICSIQTNQPTTPTTYTFKLYITDFQKKEPILEVEPTHINSGFTVNHKTIVIFRKEELYKVFIHECFHMFCLDFSNISGVNYTQMFNTMFKIKSDFLLFESFCEYWARTLNASIVAFHSKNNISFKDFQFLFQLNINIERCFSLLQMNHFLETMNTTYEEILDGRAMTKYREKTNGFCYYCLTGILFYNFEETMYWFITNNDTMLNFSKSKRSISLFVNYIKTVYNRKDFIEFIQYLKITNQSKQTKQSKIKNMYMSAFEIDCF